MFTGIVQATAKITDVHDSNGIRKIIIDCNKGFCTGLVVGASVAVDGVCVTVAELLSNTSIKFDVMLPSLRTTTLGEYGVGIHVNVERAATAAAEIGGHIVSGHIDFNTQIIAITQVKDNYAMRLSLPDEWQRYVFAKGYIAVHGASLTVAQIDKQQGWFEVWLIPATRRMTVFESKGIGDAVNIEIERSTQVIVDTVQDTLHQQLGPILPAFKKLLIQQGIDIDIDVLRHR